MQGGCLTVVVHAVWCTDLYSHTPQYVPKVLYVWLHLHMSHSWTLLLIIITLPKVLINVRQAAPLSPSSAPHRCPLCAPALHISALPYLCPILSLQTRRSSPACGACSFKKRVITYSVQLLGKVLPVWQHAYATLPAQTTTLRQATSLSPFVNAAWQYCSSGQW